MKIVGFTFGKKPTVRYQVDELLTKFNKNLWQLVHLKRAGIKEEDLVRVFTSMLRPLVEYSAVVYGPMLSEEMNALVENTQKRALKIIYGFNYTYEELLKKAGLTTMASRRELLCANFAAKCAKDSRFSTKWLPELYVAEDEAQLRKRKKYIEFNSKTERLYRSPLYTIRRNLNNEQ